MCIYSQRTFVIQFRFVVSSIFKLFQTTLDPASVCESVRVCVSVYEFDSLSSCLSVCVYLSVCLPCGCIQLYSDSFLASVVGVKSIRGRRVEAGDGKGKR